ncbi:MAG: site-specific tyrosine recombinase XerD [Kiritimatiellia bacterium]
MRDLIRQFIDYVAYERGLAENTCLAYESDLLDFITYLGDKWCINRIEDVQRSHVASWLAAQRKAGSRAVSRRRHLFAVKAFFTFLVAERILAENITTQIVSPEFGRRLPHCLTEENISRLLNSVNGSSPHEVRDRAILELFYACGLRVSELIMLRMNDIKVDERLLKCTGKGGKSRIVPLGTGAYNALLAYFDLGRERFARGNTSQLHVFLTQRGKPFTRQGIFKMLAQRAKQALLKEHVHPHMLRHSFATHLLANGAPVRVIQEMLGHADIATTQIYTHVNDRQIKSVHTRFHPRH